MRDKAFGARVTRLRNMVDLTQEEVAREIGIKYKTYQSHEGGQRPNRKSLQQYLDYYGEENEVYLVTGKGEPSINKDLLGQLKEKSPIYENVEGGRHESQDKEGLFGTTRRVTVDDAEFAVTTHEPRTLSSEALAIQTVIEIMRSNDPVLVPAIQANLRAFQMAIRKDRQLSEQTMEIKDLKAKCKAFRAKNADLEKRISALEAKPAGNDPGKDCVFR